MHTDNEIRPRDPAELNEAELNAVGGGNIWSDLGYNLGWGISTAISDISSALGNFGATAGALASNADARDSLMMM